jgi:hypothetical protein
MKRCLWLLVAAALLPCVAQAEENPYTVAYYQGQVGLSARVRTTVHEEPLPVLPPT